MPQERLQRRQVLVLQVFVDDSGGKGQPTPAVLAGLLTTAEEWLSFSEDWNAVLGRAPKIALFKMSEAAGLGGRFYKLRGHEAERDAKLRELATVVTLHHPTVLRASIDLDAFTQTVTQWTVPPLSEPYFHLFYGMIWRVALQLVSCHHTERFEIIFDRQIMYEQKVKLWYPVFCDLVERLAKEIGPASVWAGARRILPVEPVFRTDDEFMPLQCADLFAWLLRQELIGGTQEFAWLRALLPPVSSRVDLDGDYWRALQAKPESDLVRRLSDPDRYAELLGILNVKPEGLPRLLRLRARIVAASHAHRLPASPQSPEPEPPGGTS